MRVCFFGICAAGSSASPVANVSAAGAEALFTDHTGLIFVFC